MSPLAESLVSGGSVSVSVVVLVSAVVAGALAVGLPALLRRLPAPVEDPPPVPYAELAAWPWALPGGVVASAALGALLGWRVDSGLLWFLVPLVPVLVLSAYVDARVRLLPKHPILVATGVGVVLVGVEWLVTHEAAPAVRALAGLVIARALFWVLWRIRHTGMGFGDVRLAALVGLVLGRLGWTEWVTGLYSGLVLFGVWAVARAVVRRSRAAMREPLPYGPFMILGMLVGLAAC